MASTRVNSRLLFAVCLLGLTLAPLAANWMENLATGNTADDRERLERQRRAALTPTANAMRYAVSLIDARLTKGTQQVQVTWMDVEDGGARYKIYRFTDPIQNEEQLAKAKVVGTVAAGIQRFTDTLEEQGRWYYAVMAEASGAETKVFLSDQTFTATPVVFEVQKEILHVSDLKAFYNRMLRSVFLRWTDPESKDLFDVLVYRSPTKLDQWEQINRREPVAAITKGEENFQDNTVVNGGTYFYALGVKRKFSADIEKYMVARVNFTDEPVNMGGTPAPAPTNTNVVKSNPAPVAVVTNVPTPVAVSPEPPLPMQPVVTNVPKPAPVATNVPAPTPIVVAPVVVPPPPVEIPKPVVVTNVVLVSNVVAIEPPPPPKPEVFFTRDLVITQDPEAGFFRLVWSMNDSLERPFYFNVYRSSQPIEDFDALVSGKGLVESMVVRSAMRGEKFEYRDGGVRPGTNYWYAVLVDAGAGVKNGSLRLLDNYIKYPVKMDAPKADTQVSASEPQRARTEGPEARKSRENVRSVLRDTFYQEQFALAIDRLAPLAADDSLDAESRKLVLLFLGRSYLGQRQTKKALEVFVRLRTLDEETGQFWIAKTLDTPARVRPGEVP